MSFSWIHDRVRYVTNTVAHNDRTLSIKSYRNDYITSFHRRGEFYEHEFLKYIRDQLAPASVIADVGAFVGNHSLYLASLDSVSQVYAFEPFPETFKILSANVIANDLSSRVSCYHVALADVSGSARMNERDSKNRGMNRISDDGEIETQLSTLDEILGKDIARLDFMKIDTEGYGSKVIEGAVETIHRCRPLIAVEADPEPVELIDSKLCPLGYRRTRMFNATPTYIYEAK